MCGITGLFRGDGAPVLPQVIQAMTDVVAHRGPDGQGVWTDGCIGFGHRRLSILDLSDAGAQPMHRGRLTVTFNGEIYNFRELREELVAFGHVFHTGTDTEVLLAAWEQWGRGCLPKLNGMFAFALWDGHEQKLWLARDRYGVKPVYWTWDQHALAFGSEIKSLLKVPGFKVRVCTDTFDEYFAFQNVLTDKTFFEDVRLLPPGHLLWVSYSKASPRVEQWWDFDFKEDPTLEEGEAVEEVGRLFEQAVKRQLVSDVEVGAYLSGGMDSGSIAAVAAKLLPNLRTFTCGFDLSVAVGQERRFDERARAEELSYLCGTEHYEVVVKAGDMERVMREMVWHVEDPRLGQCYPNWYVSRLASKFVKVILSGIGGDEMFAGYPWRYYPVLGAASEFEFDSAYYGFWQRLVPDPSRARLLRHLGLPSFAQTRFRGVLQGRQRTGDAALQAALYFEAKTFLHGLVTVEDKIAMSHGLEVRVPFLDNDLVDFAQRVRTEWKLRDWRSRRAGSDTPIETKDGKVILRRALSRFLPESYTTAPKQGFSAPDASWFKGPTVGYIREILESPNAKIYDYLDRAEVATLAQEHFDGKVNRRLLIWSLLFFEWWTRVFLDPSVSLTK